MQRCSYQLCTFLFFSFHIQTFLALSTLDKYVQFKKKSSPFKWFMDDKTMGLEFTGLSRQPVRILRSLPRSVGEPWPRPQVYNSFPLVYTICPDDFQISVIDNTCDILEKAIERYRHIILHTTWDSAYDNIYHRLRFIGNDLDNYGIGKKDYLSAKMMTTLAVKVTTHCTDYPTEASDESYTLGIESGEYVLRSREVWGALRGLQTFSQLVHGYRRQLFVRQVKIQDFPRFSYRGILVDSARHFIEKTVIYQIIDGMEQNKMNVLHWHLSDDQSFPYQSAVFPKLSDRGAFHPELVYTQEDIADIIEYARLRGVRIIPEFDVPGRAFSWGMGHPELLTQCFLKDEGRHTKRAIQGFMGPMDPSRNKTYEFLSKFFGEIFKVFKDKFIHLGGSEIPLHCWDSNPGIEQFRKALGEQLKKAATPFDLWHHFTQRLIANLTGAGSKRPSGVQFVLWQDGFSNGIMPPDGTVIHLWKGGSYELQSVVQAGYHVVTSQCWNIAPAVSDGQWKKHYICDPTTANEFKINDSAIIGGVASLWTDYVTSETILGTLWPKAAVVAERLWSSKSTKDIINAASRLAEHRCRMLRTGLDVGQINGPDYCLKTRKVQKNLTSDADKLNEMEIASLFISLTGLLIICCLMAKHGGWLRLSHWRRRYKTWR